jgi:DNA polymerase III subunit epsilon
VILLHEVLRLERRLVGLDLETTGVNEEKDRIVELGVEIMEPDGKVIEYRTLVNPECPIPPEATAVHHITDAMVQGCQTCGEPKDSLKHAKIDASTFSENVVLEPVHEFKPWPTFGDLAATLAARLVRSDYTGFHVRFDLRVLRASFKRHGVTWDYEDAGIIDGLRVKQITEPRSLEDVARAEGIELLDAHSALADIKTATRTIASLLTRFPQLPRTVKELHALLSPDWYDADGKLRWDGDKIIFNFGKHKGDPIESVPRHYLSGFILKKDFSDKVKHCARLVLGGSYPVKE